MTSPESQQVTEFKVFEEYLKTNSLGNYKSSNRTTREIENDK
jgi:hypothetical protein